MPRPYTHGFYKNTQDIRRDRMTSYKRRRLIAQVMHRINHPKTDPYQGYAFDLSTFSPSKRPVPNSTLPYPWKKKQIVNDNIKVSTYQPSRIWNDPVTLVGAMTCIGTVT